MVRAPLPGEEEPTAEAGREPGTGEGQRPEPDLLARMARGLSRIPRVWSRSLLFRAVAFTGALTTVGTLLVAAFLTQQITTGLFQERFDQVEIEATQDLDSIRNAFAGASTTDRTSTETLVRDTMEGMEGSVAQVQRDFVFTPLTDEENLYANPRTSLDNPDEVISQDLVDTVAEGSGQYWQSVGIEREGGQVVPGVAFGTQVQLPPGHAYAVYFVYDFSPVQETLNFVLRILFLAAVAVLLLNMAIAAWVTRSVVSPISQAAEVSERIASGQLDQRLVVRGEDEIARLGISFNRMASNLQDQITQLANLSKMQQRFVSDVSHELRTPLTTVRMASTMLHEARDDFDPVNQRTAELLHHQVERFEALLADLLEMSRFDAGAAELSLTQVDVRGLAEEVLRTAQPLAESNDVTLSLVVQGDGFVAEIDPRRIDRILRNLVNNAIEHAEGRPVDLVIASSPTAVGVGVRDHGIGMSPHEVAHVFDRFWRADPARARTTGGSGLGLAIATEDTRLHQGSLDAWGQKGQGACFRLVLPRRQDAPYRAAPLALPPTYSAEDRMVISSPLPPEKTVEREESHDRVSEQSLYQPKEGEE
ncbi:MtrAB system histidine kinase MtrB [Nesterenkonia cremea]|uniref:Sensor histidine kinase MtrB n=1 Tax=Nesterenkonia cremea TaxID=1882340 RepID=A0A917EQ42_9MICC|nr:MtrAB system histidine kinase MtrB [Nesterenkonia cremea]GGE64637.1 two-component sensor histidine kinase [Nesterenkonia cremea]